MAALLTAGLLSLTVVRADEPVATPKPASKPATPDSGKPAADDSALPAAADKAPTEPAPKSSLKDAKAGEKPGDAKSKQAAKKQPRRSLIAPPGLLSQANAPPMSTAPAWAS